MTTLDNDPPSLDPALSSGLIDSLILAMFEGLTSLHPDTGDPMAALATHYQSAPGGLRYTFYLRGHRQPRGTRLANTGDLPREFSRGRSGPPDSAAARWTDGVPIRAQDFVYSWRRVVEPRTAAERAYLLYPVKNAQKINANRLPPENLGVRALDEHTLEVELDYPAPYFLELVSSRVFAAVPPHVVEAAGAAWTDPKRIVCSGAFKLRARRQYDSVVLEKNPLYYEAGQVALSELTVLVTRELSSLVNQYRAGIAMLAYPAVPALLPVLRRKRDFHPHRTYASSFIAINTKTPPFDDVRVRYALNMATDKRAVSEFFGGGWTPALGLVPPTDRYQETGKLLVTIGDRVYDVLAFDPAGARELLAGAAKRLPPRIEYVIPDSPDDLLWAQVLKGQWRDTLGVELSIVPLEFQLWIETANNGKFRHLAVSGSQASYVDPAWFLDLFSSRNSFGTHWSDPIYLSDLTAAHTITNPATRYAKLSGCERRLLQEMPVFPLAHWVQAELRKPFVRGLGDNLLDRQQFKYVWIDLNWRPL